jgi:hypothetical protein
MAATTRAQHRRLLAIRGVTGEGIGRIWDRYANVDASSTGRWLAAALPTVEGALAQTSTLAAGYLQALDTLMDVEPVTGPVPSPTIRGGASLAEVYERPIVTARRVLAEGRTWAEAMRIGRQRAVATAETDVVLANRTALTEMSDRRDWIAGWRRVLTGSSCVFCATASTQRYKRADLAPLHGRCDCTIAPIAGDVDPGRVINRDLLFELKARGPDYWRQRGFVDADGNPIDPTTAPDLVAVHHHGEMGQVLTRAGDDFTGPSDLAA